MVAAGPTVDEAIGFGVMFLSTGSVFRTLEVCPNPITRRSVFTFWSTKRRAMTLSPLFDLRHRHWFLSASLSSSSDTVHSIIPLPTLATCLVLKSATEYLTAFVSPRRAAQKDRHTGGLLICRFPSSHQQFVIWNFQWRSPLRSLSKPVQFTKHGLIIG